MRNTEMASMSHVKLYLTVNVIKAYNTLCANCRISRGELFFQLIHTKFNLIQLSTIQQICLADNHLFSHVNIFRPSTIKTVKTNSKLLLHSTVCAHLKSSDLLSWFLLHLVRSVTFCNTLLNLRHFAFFFFYNYLIGLNHTEIWLLSNYVCFY